MQLWAYSLVGFVCMGVAAKLQAQQAGDYLPALTQRTQLAPANAPYLFDGPPLVELESPKRALDLAELMRPVFSLGAEWQAEASDVQMTSYDARVVVPTYPFYGPPPPFVSAGFSYTDIDSADALDLPEDLFDYSLGVSWVRPISERWTVRLMFSTALATDGKNTSSDAWQFRGGGFGMYQPNENLTWIFGAIALGRNDLPVVPAIGAIWTPTPWLRFDLTLPKPKISHVVFDNGLRQQWLYVGGGFGGGTWAVERANQARDELTYRDWRLVVGWDSLPKLQPGELFALGRKWNLELGYVFAREFEYETGVGDVNLANTFVIEVSGSF